MRTICGTTLLLAGSTGWAFLDLNPGAVVLFSFLMLVGMVVIFDR